jgi:hypothetical protein
MYADLPVRTDINLPTFADWLHFLGGGGDAPPPHPPARYGPGSEIVYNVSVACNHV